MQFLRVLNWIFLVHATTSYPHNVKNVPTENMNGEYLISNPNSAKGKSFSTLFPSYPNVEYFDVYSPPISAR